MSYADGLATGNYSLLARSTANATLKNIVVKANAETVVNTVTQAIKMVKNGFKPLKIKGED